MRVLFHLSRMISAHISFTFVGVVANLWDVTDVDIDRFTSVLLESICSANGSSCVSRFVSEARKACKLQYLVGAAPVVYGFPVAL
jgi:separase